MTRQTHSSSKARLLVIAVVLVVTIAAVLVGWPMVKRGIAQAQLSEALRDVRSVKYALDGFATDFDGRYPNGETATRVSSDDLGNRFSNDYFRQLFLTLETSSEKIFWVKGSPVASARPPDDEIKQDGKPRPDLILRPGDCHWAYVPGLTNTHPGQLPLVLDPFSPDGAHFDPEVWNGKAIMISVDGSVDAHDLSAGNRLVTDNGESIFSPNLDRWSWHRGDPAELVAQPEWP